MRLFVHCLHVVNIHSGRCTWIKQISVLVTGRNVWRAMNIEQWASLVSRNKNLRIIGKLDSTVARQVVVSTQRTKQTRVDSISNESSFEWIWRCRIDQLSSRVEDMISMYFEEEFACSHNISSVSYFWTGLVYCRWDIIKRNEFAWRTAWRILWFNSFFVEKDSSG